MQHNKWRKITVLSSTESLWVETRLDLQHQLEAASIEVPKVAAFEPGNLKTETLGQIRRSGIRIIFLLSFDADTQRVASLAHQASMLSAGWAWLIEAEKVTVPEMDGWLWFRPFLASEELQEFVKQVTDYSKAYFNITVHPDSVNRANSAALYNAIMLYAY